MQNNKILIISLTISYEMIGTHISNPVKKVIYVLPIYTKCDTGKKSFHSKEHYYFVFQKENTSTSTRNEQNLL